MTWGKALAVGMLPFLPGDILKVAATVPVVKTLRPILSKKEKRQWNPERS